MSGDFTNEKDDVVLISSTMTYNQFTSSLKARGREIGLLGPVEEGKVDYGWGYIKLGQGVDRKTIDIRSVNWEAIRGMLFANVEMTVKFGMVAVDKEWEGKKKAKKSCVLM